MANAFSCAFVAYFHPSHWGDNFLLITSLDEATQNVQDEEKKHLKEEVKKELMSTIGKPIIEQFNMIDTIERLGLAYHFENEIEEAIQQMYEIYHDEHQCDSKYGLYHVSTQFRILRQHGFYVSCDIFKKFTNDKGDFKACVLNEDIQGILSLYEASQVRIHGDDILDKAFEFTTTYLKSMVDKLKSPMREQVAHAFEQPLHKGIVRLESKHYISFYEQDYSHKKTLLKFAKLDFNVLQYMHQKEFQDIACWWKEIYPKIPYTRDRLVEAYFWVLACYYEPQYSPSRKIFIKLFMVLQAFDDIFDAYGTYEILMLLVEAVNRWDYSYITRLPEYFGSCYQILLETVDEIEKDLAKQGMSYGVQHVKDQLNRVCKAWLQEAKWCNEKYIPQYEEYMEVGTLSIAHIVGINASFLGMGSCATKEGYEWACQDPMPTFVKASNVIFRLMNDVGSTEFEQKSRKHVVSAVQCYMKENDLTDKEHVYKAFGKQVENAWKDLNKGVLRPYPIPKPLLDRILNITRGIDVFYKGDTDGYTIVNQVIKNKIAAVLLDPIPIPL